MFSIIHFQDIVHSQTCRSYIIQAEGQAKGGGVSLLVWDHRQNQRVLCQALLEEWRSELARKPLAMSEKEACAVLGVPLEEGQGQTREGPLSEDALKAAYR